MAKKNKNKNTSKKDIKKSPSKNTTNNTKMSKPTASLGYVTSTLNVWGGGEGTKITPPARIKKKVTNPKDKRESSEYYYPLSNLSSDKYGITVNIENNPARKNKLELTAKFYLNKTYLLEIDLFKYILKGNDKLRGYNSNISEDSFISAGLSKLPYKFHLPIVQDKIWCNFKHSDQVYGYDELFSATVSVKATSIANHLVPTKPMSNIGGFSVITTNNPNIGVNGAHYHTFGNAGSPIKNKGYGRDIKSRNRDGSLVKDYVEIIVRMDLLPYTIIDDFVKEVVQYRDACNSFLSKSYTDIKYETKLDNEKADLWYRFMKDRNFEGE